MKYLIVKGWLGFGDRLESLKMAVAYALRFNLQIYVDWTDTLWGEDGFYKYFKLINIPQLNSVDEIPSDSTYHPAWWKDNIKTPISQPLVDKVGEYKLDIGMLNDKPFDADVLVISNVGSRMLFHDSHFFASRFRIIDNRVLDGYRKRLPLNDTWGIHIRGTDRVKNDNKRNMSIQSMAAAVATHGGLNGRKMIAVSDDNESLAVWKRFFPDTKVASELSLKHSSSKGNHYAHAGTAGKDDMNVDMLIDFLTLMACGQVFTTFRDSRFAKEARRLHDYIGLITA
jgi:hypothetical protein